MNNIVKFLENHTDSVCQLLELKDKEVNEGKNNKIDGKRHTYNKIFGINFY